MCECAQQLLSLCILVRGMVVCCPTRWSLYWYLDFCDDYLSQHPDNRETWCSNELNTTFNHQWWFTCLRFLLLGSALQWKMLNICILNLYLAYIYLPKCSSFLNIYPIFCFPPLCINFAKLVKLLLRLTELKSLVHTSQSQISLHYITVWIIGIKRCSAVILCWFVDPNLETDEGRCS